MVSVNQFSSLLKLLNKYRRSFHSLYLEKHLIISCHFSLSHTDGNADQKFFLSQSSAPDSLSTHPGSTDFASYAHHTLFHSIPFTSTIALRHFQCKPCQASLDSFPFPPHLVILFYDKNAQGKHPIEFYRYQEAQLKRSYPIQPRTIEVST